MQEYESYFQQVPSRYTRIVGDGFGGFEKMKRNRVKHHRKPPSKMREKRYENSLPKLKAIPERSLDLHAELTKGCGEIHQTYLNEGGTDTAATNANLALDSLMDLHDGYVGYSPYDNNADMFRRYGWQVGYVPFADTIENMVLIPIDVSNPD